MPAKVTKHRDNAQTVIWAKLTAEQRRELDALAARENRSISQQVRHIIAQHLAALDEPVAA